MKDNNYEQNKKKELNKTEILKKTDRYFTCRVQNENGLDVVVKVHSLKELMERYS